jgi:predicted O-linked N-acetylglucosamine transferase (SPINDLY family)
VADSDAQYVEFAVALARDGQRRATLRATLRDRLRASPLLDHAGFTRHLERCYLQAPRTRSDGDRGV